MGLLIKIIDCKDNDLDNSSYNKIQQILSKKTINQKNSSSNHVQKALSRDSKKETMKSPHGYGKFDYEIVYE